MAELPSDLRDLVGDILSTDGTLGMAAAELRDLAEQTHRSSFALALEVVLPLLASSTSTVRRLACACPRQLPDNREVIGCTSGEATTRRALRHLQQLRRLPAAPRPLSVDLRGRPRPIEMGQPACLLAPRQPVLTCEAPGVPDSRSGQTLRRSMLLCSTSCAG